MRTVFLLLLLVAPPAALAGERDAAALARCDSLIASGLHAEAVSAGQALLTVVDACGDSTAAIAADVLLRLVRAQLLRGGRLDPACNGQADRLLALTRSLYGDNGAPYASAQLYHGQVAERDGDFAAARTAYESALAARAAAKLPPDGDQLACVLALANVRTRLGDYVGVGAIYDQALALAVDLSGPRSADAARVLVNRAIYAKLTDDFTTARELFERALTIQIELSGEDNQSVARTHFNLANLLAEMGDLDAARTHYRQSLGIRERLLGSDSPEVARTLAALALVEQSAADLLAARADAERAVAIQRAALPALHPQRAEALSVLAAIQAELGDLDAARATLTEVLAVYEKAYGPDHMRVGAVIAQIGRLHQLAGDVPGALESFHRARAIYEADPGGREQLAGLLETEARLRAEQGVDPEATALAQRAVALRRETHGSGDLALARPLATLGFCQWRDGNYRRAESSLKDALSFLKAASAENSPYYLTAELDLARVRLARGDVRQALDLALAVEQGRRAALRVIIDGLPERLALEHAQHWPSGLAFATALCAHRDLPPADVARVWDEAVHSRALVLDQMASRYRTAAATFDASTDSVRQALASASREEAGLLVAGWLDEPGMPAKDRLLALRARRERLERRLGELRPSLPAGAPTLAAVGAAMPKGAALVGYLRSPAEPGIDPQYVAFIRPADGRPPRVVGLGPAEAIDRLLRSWRDETGPGRDVPGRTAAGAEEACRRVGLAVRERIWDPLQDALAGAASVCVVPDGLLYLVNLAALPTGPGHYLIDDDRPLFYLDAERDLLTRPQPAPASGELLALGAPTIPPGPAARGFAPLPAAAQEVEAISALWRRARTAERGDRSVLTLLGSEASEASFKKLAPHYRAVHLATHGFWFGEGQVAAGAGDRGVGGLHAGGEATGAPPLEAGPMFRSGLVLAADAGGEDGILTAAEIAVLDLGGTDWVVLSACESGVGSTSAGEGVLGLRRAFRFAGARSLVLSLWPLEDEDTRDWMRELYRSHLNDRYDLVPAAWRAGRAIVAARRAAGLDTHPHEWAAFIACGD